jgi:ATP-binding cassette subfamily A (ABC1) protein 1
MAEGQLRCAGSPLFLKKTYGVGYQLTISLSAEGQKKVAPTEASTVTPNVIGKPSRLYESDDDDIYLEDENNDLENDDKDLENGDKHMKEEAVVVEIENNESVTDDDIREVVKKAVPEAKLLSNVGTELKYQLPMGATSKFEAMFTGLDKQCDNGKISSYGVSVTTLGKRISIPVFLMTYFLFLLLSFVFYQMRCSYLLLVEGPRNSGSPIFLRHFSGLMIKRQCSKTMTKVPNLE